jgi:hypothetical protein
MKRKFLRIVLVVGSILALYLFTLAAYRFTQANKNLKEALAERTEVLRQFTSFRDDILRHDYAAAYGLMGSEFQQRWSKDEFQLVFDNLQKRHGELKDIRQAKMSGQLNGSSSEWTVHILSEFEYSNGAVPILHEFHKESQGWRMYAFQPNWHPNTP